MGTDCDWCDSGVPTGMCIEVLVQTDGGMEDNTQHLRYCSWECLDMSVQARLQLGHSGTTEITAVA